MLSERILELQILASTCNL